MDHRRSTRWGIKGIKVNRYIVVNDYQASPAFVDGVKGGRVTLGRPIDYSASRLYMKKKRCAL